MRPSLARQEVVVADVLHDSVGVPPDEMTLVVEPIGDPFEIAESCVDCDDTHMLAGTIAYTLNGVPWRLATLRVCQSCGATYA